MKIVTVILILLLACFNSFAQKMKSAVGIAFNAGIPTDDFGEVAKKGFGGSVKGFIGLGKAGQVTIATGYSAFKGKIEDNTFTIIPVLAGYRRYFGNIYAEPQIGYGNYGYRLSYAGMSSTTYMGAITWAAGVGYVFKSFDAGISYQSGNRQGTKKTLFGLHLAYNIALRRSE